MFFAIISGPVDSVVLNYTSSRKRRNEDLYQDDGKAFFKDYPPSIKYKIRPDHTVVVFANLLRRVYKGVPIIIGGIEASLRRFAHYDFQKDKIKPSILLDSRADLLVTGSGEKQLVEIARQAEKGTVLKELDLPGTARITKEISLYKDYAILPSMQDILEKPHQLVEATLKINKTRMVGHGILQPHEGRFIMEHPPQGYTSQDLDALYKEPYKRHHLSGKSLTPALQMNLFSVTSHRGCGGGCAFCSIATHEGKRVVSRSMDSILGEIAAFKGHPKFKGIVSDIGGATAELYGTDCERIKNFSCKRSSCFLPNCCKRIASTAPFLTLLRRARELKEVRKIFLGSGIRYDSMLRNPELLEELLTHHAGAYLRVAPEHTEKSVLDLMRKPSFELFADFVTLFEKVKRRIKSKVELAPYLIVGHPGETWQDVREMSHRLRRLNMKTTDAQIFTPTPGTLSTAMYYAGVSAEFKKIPVEKNVKELMRRKAILSPSKKR